MECVVQFGGNHQCIHSVLDEDAVDNYEFVSVVEQFVILLYIRTNANSPIRDALIQHTKRLTDQGGYICMQSLMANPKISSSSGSKVKKTICGHIYGQLSQKYESLVRNYYGVAVNSDVLDTVNA